ncbi:MAG TPA: hypothetical protein PKD27_04310 [Tepidiformaceae bacterium]|nr:hypothetical protein [Tepidiformaceae bacterium]
MAFTVNDLQDLIALLAAKPEWRAQLRPLILGDQFDRLPEIMQELAEAQKRTDSALVTLAARVEELAEAQKRTEEAIARLTLRFDSFREMYEDDSGALYEVRFERKAPSLFGEWLRKPRAVTINDLEMIDEAEVSGSLSEPEARQLRALDLIIVGLDREAPGYPETVLAVEVSRKIEFNDLDRAATRAEILNRLGYRARPAVGGRFVSKEVEAEAKQRGILLRLVDQVG